MQAPNGRPVIAVLHILGMMGAHRGGSATATINIADATRSAGDRTTILTTVADGEPDPVHMRPDVEIVTCRRQPPRHFSVSWPLALWLWRNVRRFDLVEIHEVFAFPTVAGWLISKYRKVPFIIHPHGSLEPCDMRKHARAKCLLRPALKRMLHDAAAVWMTADREAQSLAHLDGPYRTVVSPLPVPAPTCIGSRDDFRRRYGLDEHDRVVLFLGRLDPKKGLPRLVEAFEATRDRLESARLVVAGGGDGPFVEQVRCRVGSSRHAASIQLVGFLSGQEKADALAGADLFCLHSDRENFGITPIEALHHGTPVLLSDEVYVADDPAVARAAVVVPHHTGAGLATAMARLLSDEVEIELLASSAVPAAASFLPHHAAARDAQIRRSVLAATRSR